jgi:threonine dehydrogenase-like Zn-dependent dehydrogenase
MQQLTLVEAGRVEWEDVPPPTIEGPREALVRPVAVALCDLDFPIIHGLFPVELPVALGHEFVAEVVETGDEGSEVRPGDRVVVPFQISCGECDRCKRGSTGNCATVPRLSMYGFGSFGGNWGGGLSDLVRVPFADAMLVPLPDGVEPTAVASASDNIPDGWRTVAPQLERMPGASVLVIGGGARSIALYAVDIAVALGAEQVVYIDTDEERLRLAEQFGAEVEQGEPPRRAGPFPVTVDASGTREGLTSALRSTDAEGICTSVSILTEPETPVPLLEMYTTGLEFRTGRVMARPVMPSVLELVAGGRIHPEAVTSRVASWEEAPAAAVELERKLVITR